jgi:hypothetical protein
VFVLSIDGRPVAIGEGEQRARVAAIEDHWCIDDEWWREPIRRRYYQVLTDNGANRTLYHDLITDTWYEQRY